MVVEPTVVVMTEESEVRVERMSEVVIAEAVSVPLAELTMTAVVTEVETEVSRVVMLPVTDSVADPVAVAEPEADDPDPDPVADAQ